MSTPFPACCGAAVVYLPVSDPKVMPPMLISGLPLEGFKEVDQGVYVMDTGKYKYIDVKRYKTFPTVDFYEEVKAMAKEAGVLK